MLSQCTLLEPESVCYFLLLCWFDEKQINFSSFSFSKKLDRLDSFPQINIYLSISFPLTKDTKRITNTRNFTGHTAVWSIPSFEAHWEYFFITCPKRAKFTTTHPQTPQKAMKLHNQKCLFQALIPFLSLKYVWQIWSIETDYKF